MNADLEEVSYKGSKTPTFNQSLMHDSTRNVSSPTMAGSSHMGLDDSFARKTLTSPFLMTGTSIGGRWEE